MAGQVAAPDNAAAIVSAERPIPIVDTARRTNLIYAALSVALLVDLGRPYNIWHPLIMWNPHSVMFEVGWCVMCYSTVLALEFSPIVLERFNLHKPLKYIRAALIPLLFGFALAYDHRATSRLRPGAWIWYLLLPIVVLALYQWITSRLYGRGLLSDAASYANDSRMLLGGRPWPRLVPG